MSSVRDESPSKRAKSWRCCYLYWDRCSTERRETYFEPRSPGLGKESRLHRCERTVSCAVVLVKLMMNLMTFDFGNDCRYEVMHDMNVLTRVQPQDDAVAFRKCVVKTSGFPQAQEVLVQRLKNYPR